jgi:murein DD-endopeptidase MepM/ murein hydrolase activator NlpD
LNLSDALKNREFSIPEPPKKKKKIGRWILLAIILFWVGNSFISSDAFDEEPPIVEIEDMDYWNLREPIALKISDNIAIKSYKILIDNGTGEREVFKEETFEDRVVKELEFNITAPIKKYKSTYTTIFVEVEDNSIMNWLSGNRVEIENIITVDKERPKISILANSYGIRKAGSAVAIFDVEDVNLDEVYIETQSGRKFYPQPFYNAGGKKTNYISLVAWPIEDERFSANIVARDKAGNFSTQYLNYYLKGKTYKISEMHLKESFLTGKIKSLASQHEQSSFVDNPAEHFRIVNEDIRKENEDVIRAFTSVVHKDRVVTDFDIVPFTPLKGYRSVASFGDLRKYYFEGELVSESRHMGLDLASIRMAPVISSNRGQVVDISTKGIYGLSPIVDHDLGLYSIYSHCSSTRVNEGEIIERGTIVANTGKSGLAFGDHLHFGLYVQSIPVRPEEWMDSDWIRVNITDVIASAKQIIERQ